MSNTENRNSHLSFEWDSENERLEIHGTSEAFMDFAKSLESLASHGESGHIHLMTEDWGGNGLSNDKQNADATLIHHVKVLVWK